MWKRLPSDGTRAKQITEAIAKYIVLDMRPLDSINDTGFVRLINTLEPRYDIQSRTHITKTVLPKMYKELKEKLTAEVKSQKFVSLTTDSWTGRNSKSFTTVTFQYLNSE
jgi:hypothetical protein